MSGLHVKYSEGFNPHPKVSFGPPLSLGISSVCEYMDIQFTKRHSPEEIVKNLNDSLPSGLKILIASEIELKSASILNSAKQVIYRVDFSNIENEDLYTNFNQKFKSDISEYIIDFSIKRSTKSLILKLKILNGRSINPKNLLKTVFNLEDSQLNRLNIEKIDFLF